ncbi:hypothetical protein C6P40_003057, partial [Pichia californica]
MTESLTYNITGPIFEININNPQSLNSFTIPEFVKLANLFDLANENENTSVTLLTSTGDFFSAGANIKFVSKMINKSKLEYYEEITSKNILLVHTILNHKKLIVVALNGPVIGLSAALVCMMDIIYAYIPDNNDNNDNDNSNNKLKQPYMQFPFASIGLINECGVSASLPYRLGLTKSLEAVSFAKPITLDEMISSGFITKSIKSNSVNNFNLQVKKNILKLVSNLAIDSIIENKNLIRKAFNNQINNQIVNESMNGLKRWVDERPQTAFKLM